MFDNFDLYILDRIFNPLSLRFFKQFGVSNFTLAKMFLMLGTSVLLLVAYKLITGLLSDHNPTLLAAMCVFEFGMAAVGLKTAITQEVKWKNLRPGQLPENFRDAPRYEVNIRRFFLKLFIIIGTLETWIGLTTPNHSGYLIRNIAWLLILCGFYFLACTPPGPRSRQEREESKRKAILASSSG